MDEYTLRLVVLLALVVGFAIGLVVGGVAGRAAEAVYRWRRIRRAVAEHEQAHTPSSPRVAVAHNSPAPVPHSQVTVTPVTR